ncbi:hypothetical protein SAMN05216337_1017106 [Bradyrhizobium brasilense]|uniref:Uncharacterized protein n=1 Tax=Bradyrhizobium brasilense TaxID=1419277 RepID=A0A1G6YX62_9BRAD|nr:hypothetical protein [Bradyrhizobium brasilense]SDD94227.1 hypothetical protein SAMN05216337_1017106 [Bradyrhizobium brasilense]
MSLLLATLGNRDRVRGGFQLADEVTEAMEVLFAALLDREDPHDWDVIECRTVFIGPGRPRKVFPRVFIQRLERAIETGAFRRMSAKDVARRILSTEVPAMQERAA